MVSAQFLVVSVESRLDDLLSVGLGHVRSRAKVLEQKGRIFSYRYHCHLRLSPSGTICWGKFKG